MAADKPAISKGSSAVKRGLTKTSSLSKIQLIINLLKTKLNNNEVKGSRHWATIKEINREYRSVPETKKTYKGRGGFPISRYKDRIFIDDSPVNNLIIGTSRSGKGELFVVPAIDIYSRAKEMKYKASLIVTDPKGELAGASKEDFYQRRIV